jgi:TrmH family RNA methyltransferase
VITSGENPRVRAVARLRRARERRASGLFVAEGPREVQRAIDAGLTVRETFLAPELLPAWPHAADATAVSAKVLAKMSYRAEPEGVLAIVEAPQRELPPDPTLVLIAVGVEKPGNVGALARSADAAGADALLVAESRSDPWNPNAIRASTGAVFTLPIAETTLDEVRALTLQKVAGVVDAETPHTNANLTRPTVLIVGAEDKGLDERWRDAADLLVSIPMRGTTADSLNTSTAAAILLYEAVRQRG